MSFHVSFSPFEFFPHTPATTETGMNTEYRPHDHGKNIYKINNTKSKKKIAGFVGMDTITRSRYHKVYPTCNLHQLLMAHTLE